MFMITADQLIAQDTNFALATTVSDCFFNVLASWVTIELGIRGYRYHPKFKKNGWNLC